MMVRTDKAAAPVDGGCRLVLSTEFIEKICKWRYGIVQMVEKLTEGAIKLTPGTLYGSLSKMEKDNIIHFVREEDKRKIYQITDLGLEVLQLELKRIERLYKIAQEEM